jgi:hypothetical protein
VPGDCFGDAVSVSGDVCIVGAWDFFLEGPGSAYVFRFDGSTWNEEARLIPSDGVAGDRFGISVAISGDAAIVGAHVDDDNGYESGSAYVYRFDGSTWHEEAKLLASDGDVRDRFGWSVSISGDAAIVGAPWDDDACPQDPYCESGSAYVYRFDGSTWYEEAKLVASDTAAGDGFGGRRCLSISGDLAIIAAPGDDDNGDESGSAYVYRYDGSTWYEEARLLASDGETGDQFGYSVSASGDAVIIGARYDDDQANNSGSAYLFRDDGAVWTEEIKILASDGAEFDVFGTSVALSDELAVLGASGDDDKGERSGSAYLCDLSGHACSETICPDDPDDFLKLFGGPVTGDALDLCSSDDVRLEVRQIAQIAPTFPFIRLEYWAHTTFTDEPLTSVEYVIEGHVSALVAGGQNANTLRTSIMNYDTGLYELVDARATAPGSDEIITHEQTTNAPDYVDAGNGEVRVKQDVFDPGNVFTPNWFLKVDLYEVTVIR